MANNQKNEEENQVNMSELEDKGQVGDHVMSQTSSKKHVSPSRLSETQPSEAMRATTQSVSRTRSSTSNSGSVSAVASVASGGSRRSSIDISSSNREITEKVDSPPNGLLAPSRNSFSASDRRHASPRSESELEKTIFTDNNSLSSHSETNPRKRKRSNQEGTSLKHTQHGSTNVSSICGDFTSLEAPAPSRQGGLTPIEENVSNRELRIIQALASSYGGTPAVTTPCTEVDNIFDENGNASSSQLAKKVVKPERRLPGRKRQPHPDINIEADLRRQLQLKTNYRGVAKALKPILAELAKRTIEETKKDAEAYKRYEQYEMILQQLNTRLQDRLAYLDKSYRLKKKYAEKASQAEKIATWEESARIIRNLKDDYLLRCKCHLLSAERYAASDSDMTDEEDGPIPPLQGVTYPREYKGPLSSKYDSRSRYFKEIGRLWQEKDIRHRVKLSYMQHIAPKDGEESDRNSQKIANNHIQGFATFDVARYEHATANFNVQLLANAAQKVEEKNEDDKFEFKSAISKANALDILASASEVATPAETTSRASTKKRKHLSDKADAAKKQTKIKIKKSEPRENLQLSVKTVKRKASNADEELEPGHKDVETAKAPSQPMTKVVNSPKRVESPVVSKMDADKRIFDREKPGIRKAQSSKINDLLNDDMPYDVATTKEAPLKAADEGNTNSASNWPWSESSLRKTEGMYIKSSKRRYEPPEPAGKTPSKPPLVEDLQIRRHSFWSTVRRPSQAEQSAFTTWPYEGHVRRASQSSAHKSDDGQHGFHKAPQTNSQQPTIYPPPPLQQRYVPIQKPVYGESPSRENRYQRSEAYPHAASSYSGQQQELHEQSLRDSWEEGRRRSRELMGYEPAYQPVATRHYRSSSSSYPADDPHVYDARRDRPAYDTRLDGHDIRTAPQYQPTQAYMHHGSHDYESRRPSFRAPHHRSSSYSQDAASAYGSGQSQGQFHDSASHRSQSSRPYYNSAASSPSYSAYPSYGQPYQHPHPEYHPSYQNYLYPPSANIEPAPAQILPPPQPQPQSHLKGYQGSQYGGQAILPANSDSRQGHYNGPSSYTTPQHSPAFSQLHAISSTDPYSQVSEQPYRIGSGAPPQSAAASMPASAPTAAAVSGVEPKRRSRGRGSLPNPEFRRYFGPKRR